MAILEIRNLFVSPKSLREAEHWKLQDMRYTDLRGNVTVKGAHVIGPVQLGDAVTIGENSRIIGPVSIGKGTKIGENVLIGPYTSIGEHCKISHDCKVFSSSIYNHVEIGGQSTISGSIIDNDAKIGLLCSIENDTVIGPRSILKNRTVVHSGTRIWPEVVIDEGQVVKEYVLNDAFETSHSGS